MAMVAFPRCCPAAEAATYSSSHYRPCRWETLLVQETAKLSAFNVAEELAQTKLADLTAAKRIRELVIDQLGTKGDDLTACDIRAFASAVESCQRVARLALRVNTEGVLRLPQPEPELDLQLLVDEEFQAFSALIDKCSVKGKPPDARGKVQ